MAPFIDAKVIVSTYEELPRRRRPVGSVAPSAATTRAKASEQVQQAGGYSRRALLLAYAQQLRRQRRGGWAGRQQQRGPPLLEWGKWKTADHPVLAGGDDARRIGRRSWCSRLRCCVQLWIRAFLRRLRRITENVSCNKGDRA
ncbi:hypothetical protein BS78_01G111400 [Paspalum vaginatum]|nr:hypothetical protein BS78_01G111400 [Paspalum vaginatum]